MIGTISPQTEPSGYRYRARRIRSRGPYLLPADSLLDDDLAVELRGLGHAGASSLRVVHLGDSNRGAKVRGLHENRILQRASTSFCTFFGSLLPLAAQHGDVLHDRQARLSKEPLHHVFIHARGGTEHTGSDISDVGEFEQALDSAVFAKGAVQYRKDTSTSIASVRPVRTRCLEGNQRRDSGTGGTTIDSPLASMPLREVCGIAGAQLTIEIL